MTRPVTVRRAGPEDAGIVLGLIRELAEYERMLDEVVADEAGIARALGADPPAVAALLARAGDEPVGFALYFRNFSTFLGRQGIYLEDLFVRPPWRGHGVGRALMAALAREAVASGAARMDWAVLEWNEPAIGFYRRLGAAPLAQWRGWRIEGGALRALAGTDGRAREARPDYDGS